MCKRLFFVGNMIAIYLIILAISTIFCKNILSSSENCFKDETYNQQYCPANSRKIEDSFIIVMGGYVESNRAAQHTPLLEAVPISSRMDRRCSFLPNLPYSVDGAVAFLHDKSGIYLCSGFGSDYTGNCWKSNGAEWKDLGAKISPRRFAAGVTTYHQFTYILGGETMKNVFNTLEVLLGPDLKKSSRKSLVYGISRHCLVQVDNDNLVAIGGRLRTPDGTLLDFSDKVFSYSMFKNDWRDLPKLGQARQLHSCAVIDLDSQPKIIVVGGRNSEILKSVEIFDHVEHVWVRGPDLKSPTYMSDLVSNNKGVVYLIGGQSKLSSSSKIYKLHSLDGKSNWTEYSKNLLVPRRSHSVLQVSLSFCKESAWHLTLGGSNGTFVELHNWKTGVQCYIEPLPQPMVYLSGTLINGDPAICGGWNGTAADVKCFHYERITKTWKRISDLLALTRDASDTYIEGQGWFIFGGAKNLGTSQKLAGIDSKWEEGPPVIAKNISYQCAVKISENVTAFIGGNQGNEKNIYLYDWSSNEPIFKLQEEKLVKDRFQSTCALIKGKDGQQLVAIIGGEEKGMELWNPQTREVELLWGEIPPEVGGSTGGLRWAEVLPINDGSVLILYGKDDIWKYIVETNIWTKIGSLLSNRYGHVTLSVSGIECRFKCKNSLSCLL